MRGLAIVLLAAGCAGAPTLDSEGDDIDVVGRLLRPLPGGADQCVLTAPFLVSDRRRAALDEVGHADALGWSRDPRVAAYVRCRYDGARTGTVWRVLFDGRPELAALPMHVRAEGEPCHDDACDWPVARWDGDVLELRSPDVRPLRDRGVEYELTELYEQLRGALLIRVSEEDVQALVLYEGGVREVVRDEAGRREAVRSWDEIEVAAEDARLRRERIVRAGAARRITDTASIDYLDADGLLAQLSERLDRMRRRRSRRAADDDLAELALSVLERRSEDLGAVDLALEALDQLGRADEALAAVDRLAVLYDFDPEVARRVASRGWALALRSGHPSTDERLARAGLVSGGVGRDVLRLALVGALSRAEIVSGYGPADPIDVQDEVVRLYERTRPDPGLVTLPRPVSLRPLGVLPALLTLLLPEPFEPGAEYEVSARFGVTAALEGVVLVGPVMRFSMLPAIGVHAVAESAALENLEMITDAFRSPGAGPFVIVVRVGPREAPIGELRLEGVVDHGALRVLWASPPSRDWDWDELARNLVAPYAAILERRFPSGDIRWSSGSARALATLADDLEALGLAECELTAGEATCRARGGLGLAAVLAGVRSLGVLPAP